MQRYAFLGPSGTFTEEALFTLGQENIQPLSCPSIEDVFSAVEDGRADAGIVPIENSVEGSVNATLDALALGDTLVIEREVVLDIHHALITAPHTELSGVTEIASHPHATAQCRSWFAANLPSVTITAANSTAEAVQRAVARPGVAAVGTRISAQLHGGKIHADSIEDFANNKTRFVVVGRAKAMRCGDDKTSLALFLHQDKPGTLLMILSEFAFGDINLLKIQSRPTKLALGEYMFFVDLAGHVDDENVALALSSLRLKLREVKVLGSYPRFQGMQ
jgi:prephenate dehydratase